MLKWWLLSFGLVILAFYSIYFYQILRGHPERFEQMLMQGMVLHQGTPEKEAASPGFISMVIIISLLLEAGYFVFSLSVINILAYQVFTFAFIFFEVWHGIRVLPIMRALLNPAEFSEDLFDWRMERVSAQIYVLHVLITICLLFWL